jgi:hypothetical protein
LNTKTFNELLEIWKKGERMVWTDELASKYGYISREALRQAFKKQRKVLGIARDPLEETKSTSPVIGVFDIETLPMVVYTFAMYDQNIGTEQVIREVSLLSWAGKFLNSSEIFYDILTPEEVISNNEFRIIKSCWEFMHKCDIIIGHNLISFDGKLMNTFFLKYNLPPLKYVSVDTLLVAKANFRFSSNKLTFINNELHIRNKIDNEGFMLWRKCFEGDQSALDRMLEYNIGDIYATEDLYYRVRPYVRNINVALYNEIVENQCPVCGNTNLVSEGFYYTSAGKWESVRCGNCKALSRKKHNLFTVEKKRSLVINS